MGNAVPICYPVGMSEADLYRQALEDAQQHLARWEKLGKQLRKTDELGWQAVLIQRQAAVKQIELLIQFSKHRL